ncbi:MAG TPA: hypothetical protein VJB13_05360 [Candidatus Nanoarchaeia archaeon]|nr:hypothetical protein [Candidatus Nanoarchaeia archaeon]
MITINTQYGTVDMSTDLRNAHRDRLQAIDRYRGVRKPSDTVSLDARINSMLDQNLAFSPEYIVKNKHPAPKSTRFLMAQGDSFNGKYVYVEKAGKKVYVTPVNSWIDKHQGNYEALFVFVGNPGRYRLNAREYSLIIYPSDVQGEIDLAFAVTSLGLDMLQIIPPQKPSAITRMIKRFTMSSK